MKSVFVTTQDKFKAPVEYTLYEGGVDEIGLENGVIKHPLCESQISKNVVLFNFLPINALKFSTPLCDCVIPKVYVVFKTKAEVDKFFKSVPLHRKPYYEIQE